MKIILSLIIITLSIGVIVAPFYIEIDVERQSSITTATNIINSIAGLITLIIAIFLYNKFGIEKSLLDKQSNLVLTLLREILKIDIALTNNNGDFLFLAFSRLNGNFFAEYKDKELLFSTEYVEKLQPVWALTEDLLLPKAIANQFKDLQFRYIKSTPLDVKTHFVACFSTNSHYGIMNNTKITLGEFTIKWQSIIKTLEEWLNKNSSKKVDLNLWTG